MQKKTGTHQNCIAIIPVRGTFENEESSALKFLGKKRLIDWTIDEAIKSKKITDIVITTPDENIIRHVNKKYKDILTYKRDLRLARFDISLDEALTDLFENIRLELKIEKIFILFIEYPFRSWKFLDMASDTMDIFDIDRVISVKPENRKMYKHSGKSLVPINNQLFFKTRKR